MISLIGRIVKGILHFSPPPVDRRRILWYNIISFDAAGSSFLSLNSIHHADCFPEASHAGKILRQSCAAAAARSGQCSHHGIFVRKKGINTMNKTYTPNPIDTSGIAIPDDLLELSEYLALNTHEVWARQRIREGWQYGETLDRDAKRHPDLVPYDQLPEGEKQYDRNTSLETIKVILSLGYRIVKD